VSETLTTTSDDLLEVFTFTSGPVLATGSAVGFTEDSLALPFAYYTDKLDTIDAYILSESLFVEETPV
jgi:hypothetical protein